MTLGLGLPLSSAVSRLTAHDRSSMGLFSRRPASVFSMPPGVSSVDFFGDDVPPVSAIKPPRGSLSSLITRKLSVTGSIRSQSIGVVEVAGEPSCGP